MAPPLSSSIVGGDEGDGAEDEEVEGGMAMARDEAARPGQVRGWRESRNVPERARPTRYAANLRRRELRTATNAKHRNSYSDDWRECMWSMLINDARSAIHGAWASVYSSNSLGRISSSGRASGSWVGKSAGGR